MPIEPDDEPARGSQILSDAADRRIFLDQSEAMEIHGDLGDLAGLTPAQAVDTMQ